MQKRLKAKTIYVQIAKQAVVKIICVRNSIWFSHNYFKSLCQTPAEMRECTPDFWSGHRLQR